jgi:hypothetical protein
MYPPSPCLIAIVVALKMWSLKVAKTLCLNIPYVFSSTKLEKRVQQVLPGSEG